jgi:glycosyltransferase involved in cell wall biosynthesis
MAQVTIGLPVYNDRDFIEKSLQSLLNQTFKDFLLIISDDCSTDGSAEICLKYAKKDDRIRYIRQQVNLGISKNMAFLFSQAKSKYFMWAGDDDLYVPDFIKILINTLDKNPMAISAFGDYQLINEADNPIKSIRSFNYSNSNNRKRLLYFIKNADDGFGYGMFIAEKIKGVKFPVWWWPNRKSAYNNIFPSLCFYLAKGDYAHVEESQPLFFKRLKSPEKTHHVISFNGNSIKESLAYFIRRFNLVVFSTKMIKKGGGLPLAIRTAPNLFYYWFLVSSFDQIKLAAGAFWNNWVLGKIKSSRKLSLFL